MPSVRTLIRSFAGGEMSPEMFGRIDDVKFQSGAAMMRNFIATPQGPAENRPGTTFVREVKDSTKRTRLIPFTFSTTQTMVIEVGAGYFRFHTNGATLLAGSPAAYRTASTVTITIASPGVVTWTSHGLSNGTPVVFTTTGALPTGLTAGTIYYVVNAATNTFEVASSVGGTAINTSGTQSGTHTANRYYNIGDLVSSGGVNYYAIAAGSGNTPPNATFWYPLPSAAYEIPNPYAEADLFDIHHVQSSDVLTLVHPNYPPRELRRQGATQWVLNTINFGAPISPPGTVTATASGHTTAKYTYSYKVTAIASDEVNESIGSSTASASGNLLEVGGIVTISWTAVSGASLYRVYKLQGGVFGYIGQTSTLSIIDDNIAPDLGVSPPNYDNVFASANNYPGAVSYFEQRRCFAGTINEPQKMWMTKSGTESNMSYSLPIKDDDRIAFKVAAREANTIRHIVPLSQLVLLTSAAEWRVTSVNSDAITPTSISVQPQSYIGASNVQPSIINNAMVYCAARGGHVRELGYSWQSNGFITGDLSLRAAHLFDDYEIVDMSYSKAPKPIIWFVSSSGYLLGLTYVPEQQIGAWHWHDTEGAFESCTTVAEGAEDVLYVVVRRTINNVSKRYVERMTTRKFDNQVDAFFVDSGATYNGTNTTATTVTVTTGAGWTPADTLTITASTGIFTYPGTSDVGDQIVLTGSDGVKYLLTINGTSSSTVATARVNRTLASEFRSTATSAYSFARNSISGLTWLEGKTVSILIDGAVHPQRVVTSGAITLEQPGTIIHIGLPYESDLQTLPMAMQIDGAFGQGRIKNVSKVAMRVYRSSGIFIGPNEDALIEAKQRTSEPYGSPPSLKSQDIDINLTPDWTDGGQVFVRQQDPLPLTIINLSFEVAIGG
jgi:hypothetical protein